MKLKPKVPAKEARAQKEAKEWVNQGLIEQLKFSPLMKVVSKNERHSQSLNPEEWLNRRNQEKKFSRFTFEESAFYRDYQQLPVKYLKIEFVVNRRNVREVVLEKEDEQPLIEDFIADRE